MAETSVAKNSRRLSGRQLYATLNGKGSLKGIVACADALEVPAWAMLLPRLKDYPDLLAHGALEPLIAVIDRYMACDAGGRRAIELVAEAQAIIGAARAKIGAGRGAAGEMQS